MAQKISELVVGITGENMGLKKALNDSVSATDSAFSKIGKSIAGAGLAAGVFGAALKGIEFNKAAEQAQASFETMLGSAEKAKDMLANLKDFANKTPLEFKDIRDSTQTLVQFGMGAEEAMSTIKMLGDVSGGNAEKLSSLAVAMGQISSTGRLQGQDLMQLINSGFNPLLVISEKTGKSMAELKKDMEAGAISADMVKDAFKSATSEGGQFYGMLEKQAGTLAGKQSTLNDAFETFLGKMTEAATGPLKGLADMLTGLLNFATGLPQPLLAAAGAIAGVGAALVTAAAAAKLFGVSLSGAFGPVGLIITGAIAAITAFTVAFEDASTRRQKALDDEYAAQQKKADAAQDAKRAQMAEALASAKTLDALKGQGEVYKYITQGIFDFAKATKNYSGAIELADQYRRAMIEVARAQDAVKAATNKNMKAEAEAALARAKAAADELATGRSLQKAREKAADSAEETDEQVIKRNRQIAADNKENADAQMATWAAMDKAYGASVDAQVSADKEAGEAKKSNAKEVYAELDKAHADSLARQKADREAAEAASRARFKAGMQETISGIQGAFNAVGSEGAKTIGDFAGLVQSISKGGVWAAIGQAIGLAFKAGGKSADEAIARIDKSAKYLLEAFAPIFEGIFESVKASADLVDIIASIVRILQPIWDLLREIGKIVTKITSGVSDFVKKIADAIPFVKKLIGETAAAGPKVESPFKTAFNDVMARAEQLFAYVKEISGGISSTLVDALTKGMSEQDMFANLKEQMKRMAIEAIVMASGIQEKIREIAAKIVVGGWTKDTISTMKTELSDLFSTLKVQTDAITGIFDEVMPTVVQQSPTTGIGGGTSGTSAAPSDTLGYGNSVVVNINSPVQLNPSEAASVMRSSMRQMSFQGAFA